jgi:hypothetical protein
VKARFWAKVDVRGPDECWEWQAQISAKGYGRFTLPRPICQVPAHRFSLHMASGVPENMVTDHICRNRRCVNPRHLRAVTSRENSLCGDTVAARNAKKTHCPKGHEYSPDNVFPHPRGWRVCKICQRAAIRAWWWAKRDAKSA